MGRPQASSSRPFLDIPLANGFTSPSASKSLPPGPPLHLSTASREESTRVQLQKQRLRDQHHAIVVSHRIPGFKTSAAFFASLRTNLRLSASPPSSPWSTPPSMRASTGSLPPPSPLAIITDPEMDQSDGVAPEDPLAGVPELNTFVAEKEEDRAAGLKLVADSVAQMRQSANSSLITNPLNLSLLVGLVAFIARYMYEYRGHDVGTVATTCTGAIMVLLAFCRWFTQPYIVAAEQITMEWLGTAEVIVTRFGDEIIGAVIIDWISGDSRQKRKKVSRGEIKGWAVRLKYRKKGVGSALLEEAVKESKKKGADTIEFAEEHANSKRVLPSFYNKNFDKLEKQARELLQDLLELSPGKSRRKRGGST